MQPWSPRLRGPVDPSFRALSGRLKFTVQRQKFNKDSLSSDAGARMNFEPMIICDKYSGMMKTNPHLDHISRRKINPGTNWSNRWFY